MKRRDLEADAIDFLSFRLDRRAGCLMRAGRPIALRPKTWAVLLYLVERPGALVSREELLDAVWSDVAVTPDTLTKSIGELRVALGDDARLPRCIETVHRRGFRFLAETRASGGENGPAPAESGALPATDPPAGDIFVGRAEELALLARCFARASDGERQTVFIHGTAGVGKTALVEAFLGSLPAMSDAFPVWIGRGACVQHHGYGEAYLPVLSALERLARRPDAKPLVELLPRIAPTWLAQIPWLLDDHAEGMRRSLQFARSERMLREFAALLETLSADRTVVLVLEDLHWSDVSTIDLLSFMAQRQDDARLLLVGTLRPAGDRAGDDALSEAMRTLQLRRQCMELSLGPLGADDVEEYVERRFPAGDFAPRLAPVLHHYTGGTPLLLIAVVENMLSRGWILQTEPGWALSVPIEKIDVEMPENARRMIEVQFETLRPSDRKLLQAASVIGKEFAVPHLAAVLRCDVDECEARCDALAGSHSFLRSAGSSEWPGAGPGMAFSFAHELYWQAAYAELSEVQRCRLHHDVGTLMAEAYGERATEVAPALALHFQRSRDPARAIVYLGAAAERARQRGAQREALGYLEVALRLAELSTEERERKSRELDLRLASGQILSELCGYASERVCANYERARELCAEVGEPARLFQILYALAHVYAARSDREGVPAITAALERVATDLDSPAHRVLADSVRVRVAMQAGDFADACRLAEERLPPPSQAALPTLPFSYGPDPLIDAWCECAHALWLRGYRDSASAILRESLAAAGRADSPVGLVVGSWFTAFCASWDRNPSAAREPAERAALLCSEYGLGFWGGLATALRAWVAVQSGAVCEGLAELERAEATHVGTGSTLGATYIAAFLAEAHLHAGNLAAGLAAVERGLAVAAATLDRSYWPELWRLKGELLLAAKEAGEAPRDRSAMAVDRDDGREAERCLERAVEIARSSGAKSMELRAATRLSRVWHDQGRTADARRLLAEPCAWFDADTQSPDLSAARALVAEMSVATQGGGGQVRRRATRTRQAPRRG